MKHVDNPFQSPAILSLCSGGRGLERGLERVLGKINVAAYVEIEAFLAFNLAAQMEQGMVAPSPVWTDVKTFPSELFHKKIHGIIGGYPCQGESIAGNTKGHRDKRFLWWHIERHIKAIKPLWCFFENVENHLNVSFPIVQKSLRDMGYAVEAGIFSAQEIGATHQRERLFILALDNAYFASAKHKIPAGRNTASSPGTDDMGISKIRKNNIGGNGNMDEQEKERQSFNPSPYDAGKELAIPKSGRHIHGKPEKHTGKKGKYAQRNASTGIEDVSNSRSAGGIKSIQEGSSGFVEQKSKKRGIKLSDTMRYEFQIPVRTWRGKSETSNFPAPPGGAQYEWEEPRTTQSGMGCTINGYNFREDLLRMYGNGVVEQTAEKAFIVLLEKHKTQAQKT